jgi:hypothetical protein
LNFKIENIKRNVYTNIGVFIKLNSTDEFELVIKAKNVENHVTVFYGKKEYYDYELNWNQTQVQIKFKCKDLDPWLGCMGRSNPEHKFDILSNIYLPDDVMDYMMDHMIPNPNMISQVKIVIKEKIKRSKPSITEKLYKIDNSRAGLLDLWIEVLSQYDRNGDGIVSSTELVNYFNNTILALYELSDYKPSSSSDSSSDSGSRSSYIYTVLQDMYQKLVDLVGDDGKLDLDELISWFAIDINKRNKEETIKDIYTSILYDTNMDGRFSRDELDVVLLGDHGLKAYVREDLPKELLTELQKTHRPLENKVSLLAENGLSRSQYTSFGLLFSFLYNDNFLYL